MANCHEQLLAFNNTLNVATTTLIRLGSANRTVREHVKQECTKKNYPFKRFKVQGSKQLGTLIRKYGEDCDIDIGVYFYLKPTIAPESLMKAVHRFFVNGHATQTQPEHKMKCVRVPYSGRFHIDLPIYYLENLKGRGKSYLATRDGWVKSDPREFEDWFKEQGGKDRGQLVRLVRYLKAWCHHIADGRRMPQGVVMTTLVGMVFEPDPRDDRSLRSILQGIQSLLQEKWSCLMPTLPHDELLRKISVPDQEYFMDQLNLFIDDADRALKIRNHSNACRLLKKHLGRHFPLVG